VKQFRERAVSGERLEAVKKHLRYSFSLRLDNSETVAMTVASYVALRRTPATIDRVYDLYAQLTPDDVRNAARRYLAEQNRTIVTLATRQAGGAK
jgi:zinc protease